MTTKTAPGAGTTTTDELHHVDAEAHSEDVVGPGSEDELRALVDAYAE